VRYGLGLKDDQELTPMQNACAGSLAAFATSLVLTPAELVKCQLQVWGGRAMPYFAPGSALLRFFLFVPPCVYSDLKVIN
jgi:hypothetical protein